MAKSSSMPVVSPKTAAPVAQARRYLQAGQFGPAEALMRQVLSTNPDDPEACQVLGLVYYQMGRPQDACPLLEKSVRIAPNVVVNRINLGAVLQALGRHADSVEQFRFAAIKDPSNVLAHSNLGYAYRETGDLRAAVDAFSRAQSLQPDHLGSHRGLVSVLKGLRAPKYDSEFAGLLLHYLNSPLTECDDLGVSAAFQLMLKYGLARPDSEGETSKFANAVPQRDQLARVGIDDLSKDPLAIAYFSNCLNVLVPLEDLMRYVRHIELLNLQNGEGDFPRALLHSFARQAFVNEYVAFASDDEWEIVDGINSQIASLISDGAPAEELERLLLTYATYASPETIIGIDLLLERKNLSDDIKEILSLTVADRREEAAIKEEIESFSPIEDDVSRLVRSQYEEHPYPRWIRCPETPPEPPAFFLKRTFPHFEPADFLLKPDLSVLVAGAGTGRHPIHAARNTPRAHILTFDLSLTSLAYGIRMARKLGVGNIEFLQGDILNARSLTGRGPFDMVQSVGVLHHMENPLAGWRVLTDLLRPGGVFKVGLYSERARQAVVAARKQIAERGLGDSSREIAAFRRLILEGELHQDYEDVIACIDFYSTSMVRDLLFHVQEHRYTPARLDAEITQLGLEFLGFEPFEDPSVATRYREMFPDDPAMNKLANWEEFEVRFPDAVPGYVFWCQKPVTA